MQFQILGPLEVRRQGESGGGGRREAAGLLAILLVHANERVSSDRLIDELWPQPPETAATRSRCTWEKPARRSSRACREPPQVLMTRAPGYAGVEAGQLDAERFESLLADGSRAREAGESPAAAELLRDALALWRGDALADFIYEPFAQGGSPVWRSCACPRSRSESRPISGSAATALVGELEGLVREHPLRERLRADVLALYRGPPGRRARGLPRRHGGSPRSSGSPGRAAAPGGCDPAPGRGARAADRPLPSWPRQPRPRRPLGPARRSRCWSPPGPRPRASTRRRAAPRRGLSRRGQARRAPRRQRRERPRRSSAGRVRRPAHPRGRRPARRSRGGAAGRSAGLATGEVVTGESGSASSSLAGEPSHARESRRTPPRAGSCSPRLTGLLGPARWSPPRTGTTGVAPAGGGPPALAALAPARDPARGPRRQQLPAGGRSSRS